MVVWLDLPRRTVMRQVTARTLWRRWRRTELWNGNVEPPLRTIVTDPEHIIRWAWSSHRGHRPRIEQLEHRRPDLTIVRLRSRREVSRWLNHVLPAAPGATLP